ncbi:MAG: hypothetical protein VX768_18715, partial [Planctomycetota bacterium]|nr:hypothetical protein [Planctomycetota bacterium]
MKKRQLVVSHADQQGVLQLFRMNEEGLQKKQLTHSARNCRMPACSPDGNMLVYSRETERGISLWLLSLDGKKHRSLVPAGFNLLPSWLPDCRHVVWMKVQPERNPQQGNRQDPASRSQIHICDTHSGATRRLFSDPVQIQFSNSMPSVSSDGKQVAFVSNRNGPFRVWVSDLEGKNARPVSSTSKKDPVLDLPIEQKVPCWSPDGK